MVHIIHVVHAGNGLALAIEIEDALFRLDLRLFFGEPAFRTAVVTVIRIGALCTRMGTSSVQSVIIKWDERLVFRINGEEASIRVDLLLEAAGAETAEHCEAEEAKTKDHEQAKDGPLDLLSCNECTEGVVHLILGPFRLTIDEGEREEPTVVTWHPEIKQIIAIDDHIEENALFCDQADS